MKTDTQNARILAALRQGRRITPIEALREFGSFRLGARIFDLKKKGHVIHSRRICVGKDRYVAEYKLIRGAK